MTLYREVQAAAFPVWTGEPIGVGADAVSYPRDIEQLWTPAKLAAIGLWRDDMIAPAAPIPAGKIAIATTVERVSGVVTFVDILDDAPPRPFPTLKRKELRSALVSIGIFAGDVTAKISEIPDQTARELALIDWEDTQDYERHHPLVDTLAVAFGLPAEQVDTLWRWAAPSV